MLSTLQKYSLGGLCLSIVVFLISSSPIFHIIGFVGSWISLCCLIFGSKWKRLWKWLSISILTVFYILIFVYANYYTFKVDSCEQEVIVENE